MKKFAALTVINTKVFEASANLRLLRNISWPTDAEPKFLEAFNKGQIVLPEIEYQKVEYSDQKIALKKLLKSFTPEHPMEKYTHKTIQSYIDSIELNEAIGTTSFTDFSKKIFGQPGDLLPGSRVTNIEAAQQVVELANEFDSPLMKEPEVCILADQIKQYMESRISSVFRNEGPTVEIVSNLSAKATATSKKIKLRGGTSFNHFDFKQLYYHEVMTHALTAINGEKQPILKCMGRGTLRSLRTQEGLATFAEVITGSIDIHRLKRLALRILAIDMSLKGANFIEVFKFFMDNGQSQSESFSSAQRIFRGGYPDKNIIFTKDCVYLDGLINVHTLFRWAMKNNRLSISHLLFCGRLAIEDLADLEESYLKGLIVPPKYLPAWYSKIEGLAGSLAFSLLANLVRIDFSNKEFLKVS